MKLAENTLVLEPKRRFRAVTGSAWFLFSLLKLDLSLFLFLLNTKALGEQWETALWLWQNEYITHCIAYCLAWKWNYFQQILAKTLQTHPMNHYLLLHDKKKKKKNWNEKKIIIIRRQHVCLICNHTRHILYDFIPAGWVTALSWVIFNSVSSLASLWALLVVLLESQLQWRFFIMWQKLILRLFAKSNPDVTPTVCLCGIHSPHTYIEVQMAQLFQSTNTTAFLISLHLWRCC